MLALCAEIYAKENLKMAIKYDLEMLFRDLNVNPNDIKASYIDVFP